MNLYVYSFNGINKQGLIRIIAKSEEEALEEAKGNVGEIFDADGKKYLDISTIELVGTEEITTEIIIVSFDNGYVEW